MEIIIAFVLGLVAGGIAMTAIYRVKRIGTLRLDASDPYEPPYMFLELRKDIGNIWNKKYVILDVNNESYISQN